MGAMNAFVQNLPRPPTKKERQAELEGRVLNPIKLFGMLTPMQHALFWSAWLAWTADAYDFFCVSLTVNRLSEQFFGAVNAGNTHRITTSITLTLLFRSVGALTLGIASDRYGRKWPLIANLICIVALQIGTSFCRDFDSFLAVRSLFGIFMGGIWGVCASSGLEAIPAEARGLFSGILQQGYAVGYLIAAVVNLYAVPRADTWEVMFWVGAGITALAAIIRLLLPESQVFLRAKAEAQASGQKSGGSKAFASAFWDSLKIHWTRWIYAIVLMSFFNFFSHGSQDLFPTYMQNAKGFSAHDASIATIIGNCGAIFGGFVTGYVSQFLGRRFTIILCCLWTGAMIPLWILPNSFGGLAAGAFMVQVGVQGAWGVIPIYLNEISPPAFRALFSGLSYQLGNAASSASSQIEATAGESWRTISRGKDVPDYAKIMGLLIGLVAACIILCMLVGKEYRGARFEEAKTANQSGGGRSDPSQYQGPAREKVSDEEDYAVGSKGEEKMVERA